MLHCHYYDE